jgi:hypothetical protein
MTELPDDVTAEAERLTRLAREAIDDAEAAAYRDRRADLLAEHGYTCRVREDDDGETLVCYPEEWVEDGVVDVAGIEDTSRAAEMSLSGPGDPDEWDEVNEHNLAVAAEVRREHGPVHGANADAFADFMSNHYAKPMESASAAEVREFLAEYYPRNAWPSDEQRGCVEQSLGYAFEIAGVEPPGL